MTLADRRNLILASIDRIEEADRHYRTMEFDARANPQQRTAAREHRIAMEREFGSQWRNVKALLEVRE